MRDGPFYGPRLRRLAALQLQILRTQAKFKVGPAAPEPIKRNVARQLRERGLPGDERAADVIESYLR